MIVHRHELGRSGLFDLMQNQTDNAPAMEAYESVGATEAWVNRLVLDVLAPA